VEIDRGHTSAEAFAHKVRLHEQYRELGLFARRYDVTLEKTLVVTTSDTRRAHLQAVVRERGSGLFWITTFAAVKAHGVLDPIWFAPEAAKPQRFLPAKEGELL